MEIYLDIVIILNFLVDFFLILGTNRLSGFAPGLGRAAAAAAVGAIYAAVCVLPKWRFLAGFFWYALSLGGMSVIAFGWGNGAFRRGVLFVLLSMALGGIAQGIGNGGFWAVVLGALGVSILCVMGFCGSPVGRKFVPVIIVHRNRRLHLTAFVDTGNTLKDPISGTPVLVVDAAAAEKLLDLTQSQLSHPVETLAQCKNMGLRLVPYHAVGQESGFLLGLRVDSLSVDGKKEEMIVAFAPQKIGQGKPYEALAGGNIL